MSGLYPAFLNVRGRRCVIVGGGEVAARKMQGLLAAGASVTMVAAASISEIEAAAEAGAIHLVRRRFEVGDVDGAFLVFAATDVPELNAAVLRHAQATGALANVVDDPRAGNFQVPATVRRGEVVVAISTGGRSPSFARHLRTELEAWLTPDRIELLDLLAEVRRELQRRTSNPPAESWRQAVDDDVVDALRRGDRSAARASLLRALGAQVTAAG